MNCVRRALIALPFAVFATEIAWPELAIAAPTVWSGFNLTFTRSADFDTSLPQNQDRITPTVWLTRGVDHGIFNVAPGQETEYDSATKESPAGTLWATVINNPNDAGSIEATNWANLDFTFWREAFNGGQGRLPDNLKGNNAVVKLVGDPMTADDDIYFDLQFTDWGIGGGPMFSYQRGVVPRTGDYNGDRQVNAADYTVWRNTLGQFVDMRGAAADGDASGQIDIGDYAFWRDHYGQMVSGSGAALGSLTVPEPLTAALFFLAFIPIVLRRRHRLPAPLC